MAVEGPSPNPRTTREVPPLLVLLFVVWWWVRALSASQKSLFLLSFLDGLFLPSEEPPYFPDNRWPSDSLTGYRNFAYGSIMCDSSWQEDTHSINPVGHRVTSLPLCLLDSALQSPWLRTTQMEQANRQARLVNHSISSHLEASESWLTAFLLVCSARSSSGSKKQDTKPEWASEWPKECEPTALGLHLWNSDSEGLRWGSPGGV